MAEEEINYASVVFKTKTHSKPQAQKEEETVYDEVKVPQKTTKQAADINGVILVFLCSAIKVSGGFLPDEKATKGRHHYQLLACCLGTFCVILLLGIIIVSVYLSIYNNERDVSELRHLKDNQTTLLVINRNLTELNTKLSSENENLRRDYHTLTVITGNLTQNYTVLESKISNLTAENQKLTANNQNLTAENQQLNTRNQELETQKNNLTEQIRNVETKWSENRVTLAQQSIDAYCPLKNGNRRCKACEDGWLHHQSGCYVIHNPPPPEQKTWEEAQKICRGKFSDLAVIFNEDEKKFISDNSYGTLGYWIGLRVEDGRWKWINGSDLTESSWKQPAINGLCATSVRNEGWKSVNCHNENGWICENKAISV